MDASSKERFIDVDVAESRHDGLVEEQWLDLPVAGQQTRLELRYRKGRIEWFYSESPGDVIEFLVCQQFNAAKLADVKELQRGTICEIELHAQEPGIGFPISGCGTEAEFTGHA